MNAQPRPFGEALPEDLETEQALLGAILTSNDAYWRWRLPEAPKTSPRPCMANSMRHQHHHRRGQGREPDHVKALMRRPTLVEDSNEIDLNDSRCEIAPPVGDNRCSACSTISAAF